MTMRAQGGAPDGYGSRGRRPHGRARVTALGRRARASALVRRVAELERQVAELASLVDGPVRIVDDPSLEAALPDARAWFIAHHGEVVRPDRLASALGVSVGLAIDLCEALATEGQVVEVG